MLDWLDKLVTKADKPTGHATSETYENQGDNLPSPGWGPYVIFGDMNQQGTLSGRCNSSQNGRGGLFFVVKDTALFDSVTRLIQGESAPSSSD